MTTTDAPEAVSTTCSCCLSKADVVEDIQPFWQPSPGFGYGPERARITLCRGCIRLVQWFVELGDRPPART